MKKPDRLTLEGIEKIMGDLYDAWVEKFANLALEGVEIRAQKSLNRQEWYIETSQDILKEIKGRADPNIISGPGKPKVFPGLPGDKHKLEVLGSLGVRVYSDYYSKEKLNKDEWYVIVSVHMKKQINEFIVKKKGDMYLRLMEREHKDKRKHRIEKDKIEKQRRKNIIEKKKENAKRDAENKFFGIIKEGLKGGLKWT